MQVAPHPQPVTLGPPVLHPQPEVQAHVSSFAAEAIVWECVFCLGLAGILARDLENVSVREQLTGSV